MAKKVYCKNCRWLGYTDSCYRGYYCKKKLKEIDTPMRRYAPIIDDFEKQNRNNNCKYYQKKRYKFLKW
ncbi:hypothetical protein KAW50_03575 [candidate division WOR-3 bacterium]|nr:hypothetical protein [candidate division WOR-3 bacterium]